MKPLVAALVVFLAAQFATAADLVHKPDYQAGEVYLTESEVVVDQTLTIGGMNVETASNQFMVISEEVQEAGDEGTKMKGAFDVLQVELDIMGTSYSFSSENPEASQAPAGLEPIDQLFRALAEAEWTTETDENGRVKSMEYLGDAFQNLDPALRNEVDLQRNIDDANQQVERLPGEGIEVGQTWTRTESMNLGSGQEFTIEREFTYAGSEEVDGRTLERVDIKSTSLEYTIAPNPSLPLSVRSSDLEVESVDGAYWYDPALGVIVKSTEEMHVTGDMELEIMGQVLPSELDLTISTTTTLRQ